MKFSVVKIWKTFQNILCLQCESRKESIFFSTINNAFNIQGTKYTKSSHQAYKYRILPTVSECRCLIFIGSILITFKIYTHKMHAILKLDTRQKSDNTLFKGLQFQIQHKCITRHRPNKTNYIIVGTA